MFSRTYFAFSRKLNVLYVVDRWLNPYSFSKTVTLNGKTINVSWTKRANRTLAKRTQPIIVEMQLFFSCVVKKRVLFHDTCEHQSTTVTDNLQILFRPVEAASCDPIEFAKNYPEKKQMDSSKAIKMRAKNLLIDYVEEQWVGEFLI